MSISSIKCDEKNIYQIKINNIIWYESFIPVFLEKEKSEDIWLGIIDTSDSKTYTLEPQEVQLQIEISPMFAQILKENNLSITEVFSVTSNIGESGYIIINGKSEQDNNLIVDITILDKYDDESYIITIKLENKEEFKSLKLKNTEFKYTINTNINKIEREISIESEYLYKGELFANLNNNETSIRAYFIWKSIDRVDQSNSPNSENVNHCTITFQSLQHGSEYDYIPVDITSNDNIAFRSEITFNFPETKYFISKDFQVWVCFNHGPQE